MDLSPSLVGTVLGVLGGHYLLPGIVAKNSVTTTNIGSLERVLLLVLRLIGGLFWPLSVPSFQLSLVARRELNEKPAQLLLLSRR